MIDRKKVDFANARDLSLYLISKSNYNIDNLNLIINDLNIDKNKHYNFVYKITNGFLDKKIKIDYYFNFLLKNNSNKIPEIIINNIKLGFYEILFLQNKEDFAIVNERVNISKKYSSNIYTKLTNALLRNLLRKKDEIEKTINNLDIIEQLSINYSFPEWIINYWHNNLSYNDIEKILISFSNENIPIYLRINTLKIDIDEFKKNLNFDYDNTILDEFILIKNCNDIKLIYGYNEGFFYIQDLSAGIISKILNPKENNFIIDFCAFPGGKTSHISQLINNTGKIIAIDSNIKRKKRFDENISKLNNKNIEVYLKSGLDDLGDLRADKILVDPPCSGLGVIKRKKQIKYDKNLEDIKRLSELQYDILKNSSKYIKKDSIIAYSTCTLSYLENENIIDKFLSENNNFKIEKIQFNNSFYDKFNIFPYQFNSDGFFITLLKKV